MEAEILKSQCARTWALCAAPWRAPSPRWQALTTKATKHICPISPGVRHRKPHIRSGWRTRIPRNDFNHAPKILGNIENVYVIFELCTTKESANKHQRHVTRPQQRHRESAASLWPSARPAFRCARLEAHDSEATGRHRQRAASFAPSPRPTFRRATRTSSRNSAEDDDVALEHHHASALPARGQRLARAEKAVGARQLPALCASPGDWDGAGGREQEQHGEQHVHQTTRCEGRRNSVVKVCFCYVKVFVWMKSTAFEDLHAKTVFFIIKIYVLSLRSL